VTATMHDLLRRIATPAVGLTPWRSIRDAHGRRLGYEVDLPAGGQLVRCNCGEVRTHPLTGWARRLLLVHWSREHPRHPRRPR
jgi:hypothetical protein